MKNTSYIVAGSGFRAFCDALFLSSQKNSRVIMLDSSTKIGNVMYSRDVNGFAVDNGVHMFDSIPQSLADVVVEIMEGNVIDIDFVSESSFNNKITEGFSLPDLHALDENMKQSIKEELLEKKDSNLDNSSFKNVQDFFINRYGITAGKIFMEIFRKLYGVDPDKIDPSAVSQTSLARLKFLDDDEMIDLKNQSSFLDSVLAARRKSQGKIDDFVSIYPSTNEGMRGWCVRATKWLEKRGVELRLGEEILSISNAQDGLKVETNKGEIYSDKLIWSSDNFELLSKSINIPTDIDSFRHKVSMIFITLITQSKYIKDFTYLQNFNLNGYCQRFASAGLYSNQIKDDGTSFITCECPVTIGSELWNNSDNLHEEVWKEAKNLGVVSSEAKLEDYDTIKVPTTIKMPMIGFFENLYNFADRISEEFPNIIFRKNIPFFRREIYLESLNLGDHIK